MKNAKVPRLLLWSIVCCFFVQGCATVYNPATGHKEFIMISTSDEIAMGKSVHQSIVKQYKLSDSWVKQDRVRRIGEQLVNVSDRQDYKYNFYLLEDDELNAFTTPGGNIYMYAGLLDKLTSDDQIASVLAHEIGHCAARHTIKKFQAALGYDIISNIVFSQIGEGSVQQIMALSTNTVMNIIFSAYSRKDEFEADRLGIKYMHLACYNPQGSIETFKILGANSKGDEIPVFLRSHPLTKDRILGVEEEINSVDQKYGRATCVRE